MSTSEKKKMHILLGLLGLLFLSAFLNFSRTPIIVHPGTPATPRPHPVVQEKPEQLPAVSMLEKNPRAIDKIKRNIFQFGSEQGDQQDDQEQQESELQSGQNPQTAPPALPDIRYLGFYSEKNKSQIKLGAISNGGQIYVGGVGDVLASRYKILNLRGDFIVLKLLQENKILRIPLGKTSGPVELKSWQDPESTAISDLQTQSNPE
jgi:hypothetical protein